MLARRLLGGARGSGSFVDPVGLVRGIVSDIRTADGYAYAVFESGGAGGFATAKIIDDGAGAYVAVYHRYQGTGINFDVRLATSTNLLTWTYVRTLSTNANIPTIGRRADGSFVTGWAEEAAPWRLRLRRYTTLANLLAGTFADNVLLPQTLASGGGPEQTPNFYAVENPMDIGFAYNPGDNYDRAGRGTLTGWSGTGYTSWTTAAETAMNAAVLAINTAIIAVGDKDAVTFRGISSTFVEAQILTGSPAYGAFHIYYWNGTTAVIQPITTHGGSTEHANITVSVVESPTGPGSVLVVGLFLHSTGAATGEYGEAVYYRALP